MAMKAHFNWLFSIMNFFSSILFVSLLHFNGCGVLNHEKVSNACAYLQDWMSEVLLVS